MKKSIYTLIFCVLATTASAQVSIGGKQSVEGTTTILDFNSDTDGKKSDGTENSLGIILPAVENTTNTLAADTSQNNGTFLFDSSDKKVKMYENETWVALSEAGDNTQITVNNTKESSKDQGAIIGSPSSSAKGVLVLESADKAMILPRIANPHTTVKSPYPGMMCYDTVSKTLAVFNGSVWSYWK